MGLPFLPDRLGFFLFDNLFGLIVLLLIFFAHSISLHHSRPKGRMVPIFTLGTASDRTVPMIIAYPE
jgi:ATP/ADP translocase